MTMLDIFSQDGFFFKKVSDIHGGEYKGACPWCGGDDRFTVYQGYKGGRYICRKCPKHGDALQYLQDFRHLSYKDACFQLGIKPDVNEKIKFKLKEIEEFWKPKRLKDPPELWQKKAELIAFTGFKLLMSGAGKQYRDYLQGRGLSIEIIKKARLGWNASELFFSRESWGLDPEVNTETGKDKNIWIPSGLIIPYFKNKNCIRLRVRQDKPVDKKRYVLVSGSNTIFYELGTDQDLPSIILESELDGLLVYQEAGNLINVKTVGNDSARPDIEVCGRLKTGFGLCSLDNDSAGNKNFPWWEKNFQFKRWAPIAKDTGEDYENGVDIRQWIKNGIGLLSGIHPEENDSKKIDETEQSVGINIPKKENHEIKTKQATKLNPIIKNPESCLENVFNQSGVDFSKACLHGQICMSLKWEVDPDFNFKKPVCLIQNKSIFSINECPRGIWQKYKRGAVETVVLNPIRERKY